MMTSICTYILFVFICAQTQPKTQPGLEISFQTKLRECFSNFLGLAKVSQA